MATITIKKEVEETLEVNFPVYLNTGYSIALIFDKSHFVNVKYMSVVNYAIEEMHNHTIVSRWLTDKTIKQSNRLEFLQAYNDVSSKLSQLIPD